MKTEIIDTIDMVNRGTPTLCQYEIRCVHDDGDDIGRSESDDEISFISIYCDKNFRKDEVGNLTDFKPYWVADFSLNSIDDAVKTFKHLVSTQHLKFPNGFTSWHQTHCDVVECLVSIEYPMFNDDGEQSILELEKDKQGSTAVYDIAELLTDEFEQLIKGVKWDEEFIYLLAVEEFVEQRLYREGITMDDLKGSRVES